jgi:hypothetical protein
VLTARFGRRTSKRISRSEWTAGRHRLVVEFFRRTSSWSHDAEQRGRNVETTVGRVRSGPTARRWDMEIATLSPLAVVVAAKCVRDCTQVRTAVALAETGGARYFTRIRRRAAQTNAVRQRDVATLLFGVSAR